MTSIQCRVRGGRCEQEQAGRKRCCTQTKRELAQPKHDDQPHCKGQQAVEQKGQACTLWTAVSPDGRTQQRELRVWGTGEKELAQWLFILLISFPLLRLFVLGHLISQYGERTGHIRSCASEEQPWHFFRAKTLTVFILEFLALRTVTNRQHL